MTGEGEDIKCRLNRSGSRETYAAAVLSMFTDRTTSFILGALHDQSLEHKNILCVRACPQPFAVHNSLLS